MKLPRDVTGTEAARTVVIPQHKPLKPGTLKGILEQAGVPLEQFIEQL